MNYRDLGGMSASVVGMGCNQLGVTCDAEGAAVLVNEALDAGINYFDVADEYGRKYWDQTDPTWGLAEEYLGRALRGRRDDTLIATKFGVRPPTRPELGGASAKWIATAVEESLRRLQTDRIDLYQLHLPDPSVPIGETLTALDGLVRAGKVRAIGCSNLSAAQLDEAHRVASELGTEHFVSTQERLNLFARDALSDVMPACERLGMKFIPYQPLARGVLTGKYGRHRPLPADSRLFLYDISGDVPGQFTDRRGRLRRPAVGSSRTRPRTASKLLSSRDSTRPHPCRARIRVAVVVPRRQLRHRRRRSPGPGDRQYQQRRLGTHRRGTQRGPRARRGFDVNGQQQRWGSAAGSQHVSGQDRNLEISDQRLLRHGKLGRFEQGEQQRAGGECCQKPAPFSEGSVGHPPSA